MSGPLRDILLDDAAVRAGLADLDGWTGGTDALHRSVEFADFPTAIRFVDAAAVAAEQLDHHPDIDIRWRSVHLTLSTHSAGGVTGLDLALAARLDAAAAALPRAAG